VTTRFVRRKPLREDPKSPWRRPLRQTRLYSAAFWERYRDLADWDRHIKNIEKGEARIKRQADIMHAVAVKLDRYRNPWQVRGGPTT